MTPKDEARARLDAAGELRAAGDLAGARAVLDGLRGDGAPDAMGPLTALGLPRRLHAAYLKLAKAEGDAAARIALQYFLVPPPEALSALARMPDEARRACSAAARAAVPDVLHQVWIGPAPVPPACAAWAGVARRNGFEYRLWREDDLEIAGFTDAPAFRERLERGDYPGAVDAARYLILAREGGVYLDCDWYPARDDLGLAEALPMLGLAALAEDTPRLTGAGSPFLTNSLIACPPAHPVMAHLNAILPDVVATLPGGPAWWVTGPLIFTLVAAQAPVTLAPRGLVQGNLAKGAGAAELDAMRETAGGFLIGWKPW
ncbi:glycosyltransferase [Oceaniglobus roseus]|uniref:glycosyltransferase n=1 Tax=Oceaniglobus roseus TaxID=1737570 RepID=UPI000C7F4755|nr:glycosyltransferase [Kandeliimicrobium roseum]